MAEGEVARPSASKKTPTTPVKESGVDREARVEASRVGRRMLVWASLLAVSLLVVAPHVVRYRTLSPIDEFTHVDYLFRISGGRLLRQGDLLGQDAMRELACRRIDDVYEPPPCRPGPYDPDEFGHIKESGAAQHPPLYYALTGVLARGLQAVTGLDSLVDAGRLLGAAWLVAGLLLFWHAAERLHINLPARVAVIVLIATTPVVVHASATVNNDASALVAGGILVVSALAFEDRRIGPWVLMLVAAVVVLGKATNVVGVLGTAVYLGIRSGDRPSRLRWGAGALVAGAALSLAGWLFVHGAIARTPSSALEEFHRVETLQAGDLLSQAFALVTPVVNPHLPPFLRVAAVPFAIQLLSLTLIATSFGGLLGAGRTGPPRALGIASATVMILGGIALTLGNYLIAGIFFPIPSRYGLSLLPMLGLSLAAALTRRPALLAAGALAVLSTAILAYGLVWGVAR